MTRLILQLGTLTALGFCLAALGLHAAVLFSADHAASEILAAAGAAAPASKTPSLDSTERDLPSEFPETMSRPVFFSDRAFPGRLDATPASASDVNDIKIWGVLIDHATRKALIAGPSGNAQWFSLGDRIDQWVIKDIDETKVILRAAGREVTLKLYRDRSSLRMSSIA